MLTEIQSLLCVSAFLIGEVPVDAQVDRQPVSTQTDVNGPVSGTKADVVVIPIHGSFGFESLEYSEWVDVRQVRDMIRRAKSMSPSVVVLDIESPGGQVQVMHELGEALQQEFPSGGGGPRLVAWPGQAGSAASYVTLTCPTIISKPAARVGAALKITETPKGYIALDDLPPQQGGVAKKMQSFVDALERSAMQFGGHNPAIWEAMAHQRAELWWSPGAKALTPTRPEKARDAVQVDSPTSVLTLTSTELLSYGVSLGEAGDERALIRLLELPAASRIERMGGELPAWFASVKQVIAEGASKLDQAESELLAFRTALTEIASTEPALEKAREKRKGFSDKDRGRDSALAEERKLSDRLSKLRRDAGRSATRLATMISVVERANSKLASLGTELSVGPVAWIGAGQIRTALACFRADDTRGALASVSDLVRKAR